MSRCRDRGIPTIPLPLSRSQAAVSRRPLHGARLSYGPVRIVAAALLLAGCGAGGEAPEEAEARSGPAAASEERAAASEERAAASEERGVAAPSDGSMSGAVREVEPGPGEVRLGSLRMLTAGGSNAEAYFSADGRRLIFQATRPGEYACDQIYTMDVDGGQVRRVSTGAGRTTCGYFFPSGDRILFSSTHHRDPECPAPPDRSRGYVWPLHPYDIFLARPDGSGLVQLTDTPGYDAEATISPDGEWIVFTSTRAGDPEIYKMRPDGSDLRRLTHEEGYDGGAFFSPDGTKIVYRAHHPTDPDELEEYRALLADGLVRPSRVELFVMNVDGSGKRRVTDNGAANFAPFFHPDGERIIFSSNLHDPGSGNFDLYLIGIDGTGLERITHNEGFDGFPMFDREGKRLVFSSSRGATAPREFNVFLAEWLEDPGNPAEPETREASNADR